MMSSIRWLAYICFMLVSLRSSLGSNEISAGVGGNLNKETATNEMHFYSQASQDKFVYELLYNLLGKQDQGFYLEVGAGDCIVNNNSFFFEKNFGWHGISIDISSDFTAKWYSIRKNLLIIEDATQSNYGAILKFFPYLIDYLSLDIDQFYTNALEKIIKTDHIFKIITIEHDYYRYKDLYREKERQILTSLGYHLLCSNVLHSGFIFEDWWIHPIAFSSDLVFSLCSLNLHNKDHAEIIQMIQGLMINRL